MDPLSIALILYLAGIVLAFVDLFVPSGGMLIVLAAFCGLACVLFGFRSSNAAGTVLLIVVLASIPTFAFAAIKIWPLTPIGKRIILKVPKQAEQPASPQASAHSEELIGEIVVTASALMPAGQIQVGHKRYNAIAREGVIEAGSRVKVLAVRDRNFVVEVTHEQLPDPARQEATSTDSMSQEELLDLPANDLGFESLDS